MTLLALFGRYIAGFLCLVRPHVWSSVGDEDEEGWFWDNGWGADCLTRSCCRCDFTESRSGTEEERSRAMERHARRQRTRGTP